MNKILNNIYIAAILLVNPSMYALDAKYELRLLSLRNQLGLPYNSPLSNDAILNQAIDAFQTSKPDYIKPALCGHIRSISNYDNLEESRRKAAGYLKKYLELDHSPFDQAFTQAIESCGLASGNGAGVLEKLLENESDEQKRNIIALELAKNRVKFKSPSELFNDEKRAQRLADLFDAGAKVYGISYKEAVPRLVEETFKNALFFNREDESAVKILLSFEKDPEKREVLEEELKRLEKKHAPSQETVDRWKEQEDLRKKRQGVWDALSAEQRDLTENADELHSDIFRATENRGTQALLEPTNKQRVKQLIEAYLKPPFNLPYEAALSKALLTPYSHMDRKTVKQPLLQWLYDQTSDTYEKKVISSYMPESDHLPIKWENGVDRDKGD